MHLLSSLKSDIVRTVLSFLGIMNVSDTHRDDDCHTNTPMVHSRLISFMRMALCLCRRGYGLPWYHFMPSFNLKDTGGKFQSPSMPSNSNSNFCSIERSLSLPEAFGESNSPLLWLEDLLFHT
jgi:hypothetical protein